MGESDDHQFNLVTFSLSLFLTLSGVCVAFTVYLCLVIYAFHRNRPPVDAQKPGKSQGLSPMELQRLPGIGDGGAVAGTECVVCLDDIEAGQVARVLPTCGHAFHRQCADAWLATSPACPICRTSANLNSQPEPAVAIQLAVT